MGVSFAALTRGLLGAAVARREGQRQGVEDKRKRRSESLLDTLREAGARDAGVVDSPEGFIFDPSQSREARERVRETERNRGAFDELLGRGDVAEGTAFNPDIDFGDIRDETLIDTIKRTQAERRGPEPLSEQDQARLDLTRAQTGATTALAENRSRPATQENPQAKRLNQVLDDLVKAREGAVSSGVLLTPDGKESLGRELDAIARLRGYEGVAEVAALARQRGLNTPTVDVPAVPDPAPPTPEGLEFSAMLEQVRGSSMSAELKAIAEEIDQSTEVTDTEKLDLLRQLVSG